MTRLLASPTGSELLDDPAADPALVARSLGDIARANRWLGGHAAVRAGLRRLAGDARGTLTLLDVGTGSGDIPAVARRWMERRRRGTVRGFGIEQSRVAARLARRNGVDMVVGCGGSLPFGDRSVDVVVLSQVAHHLDPASCHAVLRECARVARRGVIVADLHRSAAARIGWWFASRALGFDPVTRADGDTSIRRGFTVASLHRLLADAGLRNARVARRPGARVVATWVRP